MRSYIGRGLTDNKAVISSRGCTTFRLRQVGYKSKTIGKVKHIREFKVNDNVKSKHDIYIYIYIYI